MDDDHNPENPFPNVRNKLSAPAKKSAFEKQRLEAEAKRLREEAETAAVYKDFVASFDDEGPEASSGYGGGATRGGFGRGGFRGGAAPPSGPGRRHFTGTRGGALGGVKKRSLESAFEREEEEGGVFGEKRRNREAGLLAFENPGRVERKLPGKATAVEEDSDDESKAHPKPTVLLSSLPPNITNKAITELLAETPLKIDSIKIIPAPPPPGPSLPSPSIRKAATALVTLSSETPSSDIDSAVSLLNGRYMGYGFWLSIVRHLSSTVAGATTTLPTPTNTHPFGAIVPKSSGPGQTTQRNPHRGGFAPPTSFAPRVPTTPTVHVQPPQDLKLLKIIHRTIESLLTHGPSFEALLMAQPPIRHDPNFSFLWDARSPAGTYYRWKLWDLTTGYTVDKPSVTAVPMFDPFGAPGTGGSIWIPPKKSLKYEFAATLADVVDDPAFVSDEDEDSDTEAPSAPSAEKKRGYLGVLPRAKLLHLISRLPTTTSKVRRGDVGRVMAFAMEHAEGGMGEEVVDVLVNNILHPLQFTPAKPQADDHPEQDEDPAADPSAAKIIALWLISDVLSNSSLGVRAAWRYRQLFENALKEKKVFAHLGDIYRGSGWGRMKAEKFRRGVIEGVVEGWEKWCVFSQDTLTAFKTEFNGESAKVVEKEVEVEKKRAPPGGGRWKTVEVEKSMFRPAAPAVVEPDEDVDGVPLVDDDVDGEPLVETDSEDEDGEMMSSEEPELEVPPVPPVPEPVGEPMKEPTPEPPKKVGFGMSMTGFKMGGAQNAASLAAAKRKRPKAEDMFADSD